MAGYFLGIDQGTTLTTAVLADESWRVVARASIPHRLFYPKPGWVEMDPLEIYNNCLAATAEALSCIPGASANEIIAMGLDHQGETCMVWDRDTGVPIYNAIVWQDRRTSDVAEQMKVKHGDAIRQVCGMLPDAYHSATKINWLLDNVSGARKRAEQGELLIGTLNTWLFWKMSGGEIFKTDPASASCMMLMDIRKTEWSDELIDLLEIPKNCLAKICDCNHLYGYTKPEFFLGTRIPITGSTTDSPSSLIGGGCVGTGVLKTSYGTAGFMTLQTGRDVIISKKDYFQAAFGV